MVSTVTISEDVRRKIKRLAALLDTSQSKIVEMAIDFYEKEVLRKIESEKPNIKVRKVLEEAEKIVNERDPDWARVSEKVKSSIVGIEAYISYRWAEEL
ncbi:MAG: hypothetical protein ACTSXW_07750 [Candidatus Baldrarchaeia archaeon]